MHFRGTYQKTLARILSAVAIIMALLISVLSGAFLERQTHAEYEVLKCASNQSIIRWVNSSSLPEYYFNAIEATKGLQESINNTLPIEYQCALMPLSVKAFNGKIVDMVLTHNRTMAVSELLSTLHIDQQEYLRLIDHFYDSDEPAQGSSPIPITQRSFRSTASRSTRSFQFQKVLFIMAKPRILLADTYWSPESHLFSG